MKSSLSVLILSSALLIGAPGGNISVSTSIMLRKAQAAEVTNGTNGSTDRVADAERVRAVVRYQIDPAQSRFMASVGSGGLLWFMGHSHHFAARDFTGEATITPESIAPASLQMTIRAASLEETGKNFTEQQKQIINESARREVLQVARYPEIVFKSTNITGRMKPDGQYEAKIEGNLTLHGVTRPIEIATPVTVKENTLHAKGTFSINRSDYGVKTHSIKWGTIRVRNRIRFEFDIVANKV